MPLEAQSFSLAQRNPLAKEQKADALVDRLQQLRARVDASSRNVSLEEAIELGLRNNPDLVAAFRTIQQYEWQLIAAQGIAIAKALALIHQPQVLIMDEATSALDPASQQRINATVQSLGITRISIAHRLATIKDADRILVLRDGAISENGTWDELCEHGYLAQMLSKGR